ncbi:MAG: hypothetical protein FWD69_11180 [Polyangiaceae bacterium]|nr:hypothetical protein [Polyangiaceae bacterium]
MIKACLQSVVSAVLAMALLGACASVNRAVHDDPMRCERDPKCEKKRSEVVDCSQQCNDDPACMDRCETIQVPNSGLGH